MKKIIFSLAVMPFTLAAIRAQNNPDRIYLNYSQFESNRPAYVNNENTHIRSQLFGRHFITIKQDGEKTILFKDDMYAYKTSKGEVVRYWKEDQYHLLEEGAVWIYYRDVNVSRGKGIRTERRFYYSVSGKDEILPLTIWNLKNSFPDKHLFQNFLDAQFRSDTELSLYNNYTKEYQVNHLLRTTNKS